MGCVHNWTFIFVMTVLPGLRLCFAAGISYEHRGRLLDKMFEHYRADSRPVLNTNTTTLINSSFHLRLIHQLDERHQKFVTSGWFSFNWFDELLRWDPVDYGNITSVITDGFWKPDIMIYNGYEGFLDLSTSSVKGVLKYDGNVTWAPAMMFVTHCHVDVTFYPFDSQTCSLEIISWTSMNTVLNLVTYNKAVNMESFIPNVEWDVQNTSAERIVQKFESYDGEYPTVFFNITVVRRRTYFVMNILVPAITESVLCNLVFLVPSESGERMSLSITVLLSYAVFLTVTTETLPKTSLSVSVMSIYMVVVLILGTVSVILTGISLYIYHSPAEPATRAQYLRIRKRFIENQKSSKMGLKNNGSCIRPKGEDVEGRRFPVDDVQDSKMAPAKSKTDRCSSQRMENFKDLCWPEYRFGKNPKDVSRQFDRICLKVVSSLTLISVLCLFLALTWHD